MMKNCIENSKCRRGTADGTTKSGAYWFACDAIKLRCAGGDGIGQSGADITFWLELRHYRSGECRAVIHRNAWHQNGCYGGGGDCYTQMPAILVCATVEDVIVALKAGIDDGYGRETCYSDYHEETLTAALTALGLPATAPAPDDMLA